MSWKDISSYDYTDSHTLKDWGWEFIRRDERYKAEWKKAYDAFTGKNVLEHKFMAPDLSQYSVVPEVIEIEGTDKNGIKGVRKVIKAVMPRNLIDEKDIDSFILPYEGADKWGVNYYQHPSATKLAPVNNSPIKAYYRGDTSGIEPENSPSDEITVGIKDDSLIVVFDIKKPLAPQLEIAKKLAEDIQNLRKEKISIRTRGQKVNDKDKKLWVSYLRCIDAVAADLGRGKAAKVIFSGYQPTPEKKWDDIMQQIKELEEKNYSQFMY